MTIFFSGVEIDVHSCFQLKINQMIASPNAVNSPPVLLVWRAAPRKNGDLESVTTEPNNKEA